MQHSTLKSRNMKKGRQRKMANVLMCNTCGAWLAMLVGNESEEFKINKLQEHREKGECPSDKIVGS